MENRFLNSLDINTRFSKIDEKSGMSKKYEAHTGLTEADFAIKDTEGLIFCLVPEKPHITS